MPEYLVNMPYNLESWPFAIRSVTKKQALEWGKKALCPKHCNPNKGLSEGTKLLVHRCLLLQSAGEVQASNTVGNWAAQEFEAEAGLLCLSMSQQFLKISEFQESCPTSSEPLPPSCIRNTGGLCISGMQKTGTVRSMIQPRWCVGTWLKLIKRSLRQTDKKKSLQDFLKSQLIITCGCTRQLGHNMESPQPLPLTSESLYNAKENPYAGQPLGALGQTPSTKAEQNFTFSRTACLHPQIHAWPKSWTWSKTRMISWSTCKKARAVQSRMTQWQLSL